MNGHIKYGYSPTYVMFDLHKFDFTYIFSGWCKLKKIMETLYIASHRK